MEARDFQVFRVIAQGHVPSDWNRMTVQELLLQGSLELVQDGNHGGNYPKQDDFADAGIPLVTGADIEGGTINLRTCKFLKLDRAANLRIGFAKTGDVLLSHKGTMGKTAIVPAIASPYIILNPQLTLYRVPNDGPLDRRFLKYFFDSALFQSFLARISSISTISTLSLGAQKQLEIPFPSKAKQRAIVSILAAFDDKIDLNRRMNETLEATARAIFKDWFVDFGPTLAKIEGSAPYLAPNIWALFPDRLDDVGRPEAWTVGTLADYANLNPENWSRVSYPLFVRYVDLSGTKWGTIEHIELHSRDDAPSRARRVLRPGDTIVGMVRPGNGSYAFVSEDGFTGSTGFAALRPMHPDTREFVYLAVTTRENIDRLAHLADGAAYPAVRPEVVMATVAPIVAGPVMRAFSRTTGPLIDRMEANKREGRTLAATRDLLLPKLMSGEIHIKGAEKVVEAAL